MRHAIRVILCAIIGLMAASGCFAQKKTIDGKKIKEIQEWKTEGAKRYLSEVTKYDAAGKKTEQTKYDSNKAQKERFTYKYNEAGKLVEEVKYDEYNKVDKKTVTEYNEAGKRIKETTYDGKGKVKSFRDVVYITE